jgi:hypothetical protein
VRRPPGHQAHHGVGLALAQAELAPQRRIRDEPGRRQVGQLVEAAVADLGPRQVAREASGVQIRVARGYVR